MAERLTNSIEILKQRITSSNLNDPDKKTLLEVLKSLASSPNGRFYFQREDNYVEYLTFKAPLDNQNAPYEFCIIEKQMEYSGATAGRRYRYPNLEQLSNYINSHKEAVQSEIKNIEYYNKYKDVKQEDLIPTLEEQPSILNTIRKKIEKLQVPSHKKQRIFIILDKLLEDESARIFTIREDTYEEFLSLKNGSLTVTRKMLDYAGATMGKTSYTIKSDELIEYVEKHKTQIDASLSKGRKL